LTGEINILGDSHISLLNRALQIDVANLLAEIRRGGYKSDQTIFHLQLNVCSLSNILQQCTACLDRESIPTIAMLARLTDPLLHTQHTQ
jgi:hypothetical protein